MKLSLAEFDALQNINITLLGMSGVGKTRLSCILRQAHWFHYSGDYRIGTRYMGEAILDNIKRQAMQVPFLRDLLCSDSIYIGNNISIDHLKPVSTFLGKVGNPEFGGLGLDEFKRRQRLHLQAEMAAMRDVPEFMHKARNIYDYQHFVNDASGSLCEIEDESVMQLLAEHSIVIYIQASKEDERELIARAERAPKPLYYRESFLDEQLAEYLRINQLEYVAQIDPDDFARWVFSRLFNSRIPRYERLARDYGYTVSTAEIAQVQSEQDFIALLRRVVERGS